VKQGPGIVATMGTFETIAVVAVVYVLVFVAHRTTTA
jgi:hypothetical protein